MRESAIIYRSFYEAIKGIPELNQAEVWNAIMEYSLNFNEIELTGLSKTIFILIKPQLAANINKFKNGSVPKNKLNGSKTEANKKQKRSKAEAKGKQKVSKREANVNDNVNENDNVNDNENAISLEAVILYFKQNDFPEHLAKKFFEYYSVNDWKDSNGKKISSWKQKAQSVWFKEENKPAKPNPKTIHLQSWL